MFLHGLLCRKFYWRNLLLLIRGYLCGTPTLDDLALVDLSLQSPHMSRTADIGHYSHSLPMKKASEVTRGPDAKFALQWGGD